MLPLLLLVVIGVLTFGLALSNYLSLTEATGIGARQLAISRGQTLDPCATVASAVSSAAPLLSSSSLGYSFVLNGNKYSGSSCASPSTTTGPAGSLMQGALETVTVTYPCSLMVMGVNYVPGCTLTAQTSEAIQ